MSVFSKFVNISLCVSKWQHCPSRHCLNRLKPYFLKPINIYHNRSPWSTLFSFFLLFFTLLLSFLIACLHLLIIFDAFNQILFLLVSQILRRVIRIIDWLILFWKSFIDNLKIRFYLFVCFFNCLNLGAQVWGVIGCRAL